MYRYRCTRCGTTSPIVRTWVEVLEQRDRHRARFHGGHRPDGERLLQRRSGTGPAVRPAVVVVVVVVVLLLLLVR